VKAAAENCRDVLKTVKAMMSYAAFRPAMHVWMPDEALAFIAENVRSENPISAKSANSCGISYEMPCM
jgi:hypothetical protein